LIPSTPPSRRSPQAAVGVVCFRGRSVLLVRRGTPPLAGAWSLPGGRIEWGERAEDAALRELMEETGVRAELQGLIAVVDGLFPEPGATVERHYVLIDYAARWLSGEPTAGDDAAAAAFHPVESLDRLDLWDETLRIIGLAQARLALA
jgi:8-oxo-dGTP diphosphatase